MELAARFSHIFHVKSPLMQLFTSETRLGWGALDLPLLGLSSDWHGRALVPPAAFVLASDEQNLWFVATREAPVTIHPNARPGSFTPELWKHDVAELFISDPDGGGYMEFNLAANGAWWACSFDTVRSPAVTQPDFASAITTHHEPGDSESWLAALVIPIGFLKSQIGFGLGSHANVAFILNSPEQTFHSVSKLPGEVPDFHQPQSFERLVPMKMPTA